MFPCFQNKECIKIYKQNNKEKNIIYNKKYNASHKNVRNNYRLNNKNKINNYQKDRRAHDPHYRLRANISRSINHILTFQNMSKNNKSCLKYLPYSVKDLKIHLESRFEPWMTWNNHGIYNAKIWDDNDSLTWTWQIDHIIPHSTFKYSSMEDEEFKKCWALDNLRPLSAKQNFLDGVQRTRH